jgi:asparagine synthase (glutamine-hydrolysing)
MRALTEKFILKKSMQGILPASIVRRTKQPYRSPDAMSFLQGNGDVRDYVSELLSEERLRACGYFNPRTVASLVKKCRQQPDLGFKDNMALVGILSTQLLHDLFIRNYDVRSRHIIEQGTGVTYHATKA